AMISSCGLKRKLVAVKRTRSPNWKVKDSASMYHPSTPSVVKEKPPLIPVTEVVKVVLPGKRDALAAPIVIEPLMASSSPKETLQFVNDTLGLAIWKMPPALTSASLEI